MTKQMKVNNELHDNFGINTSYSASLSDTENSNLIAFSMIMSFGISNTILAPRLAQPIICRCISSIVSYDLDLLYQGLG